MAPVAPLLRAGIPAASKSTQWSMTVVLDLQQAQAAPPPREDPPPCNAEVDQRGIDPILSPKPNALPERVPFEGIASWAAEAVRKVQAQVDATRPARVAERMRTLHEPVAPYEAPKVPHFLPVSHTIARSKSLQSWLVVDDAAQKRTARLSWYDPATSSIVPRGWLTDGLLGDFRHYVSGAGTAFAQTGAGAGR